MSEDSIFIDQELYRVACCWERNTRTLLLHNKLIQKKIGLKARVARLLQTYIFTVFCFISLSIVPQPEVTRLLPIDEGVKSLHLKNTFKPTETYATQVTRTQSFVLPVSSVLPSG